MMWSHTCGIVAVSAFLVVCQLRAVQPHTSRTPEKFQNVEALVQQGRLADAKTAMLDELQRNPSSIDGYNLLGIIDSDEQDYSSALAAFQKALKLAPNSTKTHVNLGNVYVAQKRPDLAEKEFRAVLRFDPANQDGNYNLGVLLMARKAAAEAIPHFERVHPSTLPVRLNLIHALFQAKRAAEALRMATALSAQNKNDVQVRFSLGLLLASEGQYKPAQLELEEADILQPGTFEIIYNLGQASLRDGNNAAAELSLTRALKLKPDSPDALYLLAQVFASESRPRDALELLVRAHKLAPENTDVIYLMAEVSMSQNFYEDAVPVLESGLQIAPQRSDLRAALGKSYFMAGKVDQAIEVFKKLTEVDRSARPYALLGVAYRQLGRYDEAKQSLQNGLALDPRDASCLFNLGLIEEQQGDSAGAESMLQQVLRSSPSFPDALLELANLRIAAKKLPDAEQLLRKYVRLSPNPATGYYKLAIVERSLHETAAADRDLSVFQTLSKDVSNGPHHFEHLFDYLDTRSQLAPNARDQIDLDEIRDHIEKNPGRPDDLYLLAEACLKSGRVDEARSAVAHLDKMSPGDYRNLTGVGVLLARYHLYDDAIQHFQAALQSNQNSDEIKFDLANAFFRKRRYSDALDAAKTVSAEGSKDDAYLALLGDIYAHLGDTARAEHIYQDAIIRNPDNDQDYLALALLEFREKKIAEAKQTLLKGRTRIPGSGRILWGLGIASALEGKTEEAAMQLEGAVDMLPEWPGSYSLLGVFYYQTGQIDKAKEMLDRFKNSNASGSLDVNRIEQFLAQAPAATPSPKEPMNMANKAMLLQMALSLADRTL